MHPRRSSTRISAISPVKGAHQKKSPNRAQKLYRRGLLAALFVTAAAPRVMAAQLQVPVLEEPASQEHHPGKVIFLELVTPDLDAAKVFYQTLFGWTFRDLGDGKTKYAQAWLNGHPIAGMIQRDIPAGEHRQPAWLTFLSTRDVDATKAAALQHGAKVLFEPRNFPDRGREAVFADPQGAVFAVLASSSGDPPDVLVEHGEWIWSSLITSDPDADAAFYKTLFGYEVFSLPPGENTRHLMLASDDYARASVNSMPAIQPGSHPHWLSYVRVNDAVKAAAKLVALGGAVLVKPRVDRHGGKIAVVTDAQGAPFGLLEWPETESKKVSR